MRWILACLGLLLLPGCFGSPLGAIQASVDCSVDRQVIVSASKDFLFPSSMPQDARESFGTLAKLTVHAREGQKVQAVATWVASGGSVDVEYDGPRGTAIETDNSWTSDGEVGSGDYTLELVGSPMAFDITYTLYLTAYGCTPVGA
jgi:hypothetical protein